MKLYSTDSSSVEPFAPRGRKVTIYVCGITPYDTTHLGHAFTYTAVDILIRYLEWRDLEVLYVQNVTDIDDDILRKAGEVGESWQTLGNRWTSHFVRDMIQLNVLAPDHFPRATEVIPDIIESVEKLLAAGVAYQRSGNVYYHVDSFPKFGELCHLDAQLMLPIANQRGNHPDDPYKDDPLDFVLWQAQKPGEPAWDSPWGSGRPGWHIECSTMAAKFLGEVIDIHGGGLDLCFPHHEAEIAQMEPIIDSRPFVRFWMHTAMVEYQGEKMSKSLGNLIMISDLLKEYTPDALRLYLGSHHYRKPWSYKEKDLQKMAALSEEMRSAVSLASGDTRRLESEPYYAQFIADMENDLDTPGAVEIMKSLAEDITDAARVNRDIEEAQEALREFAAIFGMGLDKPGPEMKVEAGWKKHLMKFET